MKNGKLKVIPESDIRKDVRVIMPSLDLFPKQNRIERWPFQEHATNKTELDGLGFC